MIRVCIPFYMEFEYVKPVLKELKKDSLFDIEVRQGTSISKVRNSLIVDNGRIPLKKYSHFLLLDSDVSFNPNIIYKLIEYDKDIVGAPYKHHKGYNNVWKLSENGRIIEYIYDEGFKKVGGLATGMMLVKREVFEEIGYPWFYRPVIDREVIGLDVNFCLLAKKHNFDIWCDFELQVKHNIRSVNDFDWNF